jgi:hypothetical protein
MRTLEDHARAVLDGANACAEHHSGVAWADVAEIVAAFEGCRCEWAGGESCLNYCDREGAAILRLVDGRIAAVWEDEDTTGHG